MLVKINVFSLLMPFLQVMLFVCLQVLDAGYM